MRNVGSPLIRAARINCSVAGARTNWSAASARDDACATIGEIRTEKKKTGK